MKDLLRIFLFAALAAPCFAAARGAKAVPPSWEKNFSAGTAVAVLHRSPAGLLAAFETAADAKTAGGTLRALDASGAEVRNLRCAATPSGIGFDAADNLFIAEYAPATQLRKLNAAFVEQWKRPLKGSAALALAGDGSGGVIVAESAQAGRDGFSPVTLAAFTAAGEPRGEWQSGCSLRQGDPFSFTVLSEGGLIALCARSAAGASRDIILTRIDATGRILWQVPAGKAAELRAGTTPEGESWICLDSPAALRAYAPNGGRRWEVSLDDPERGLQGFSADALIASSGTACILGTTVPEKVYRRLPGTIESYPRRNVLLQKFDASGSRLWLKRLGWSQGQVNARLLAGSDGDVYVLCSGLRWFYNRANIDEKTLLLFKYDAAGTLQWVHRLERPGERYELRSAAFGDGIFAGGTAVAENADGPAKARGFVLKAPAKENAAPVLSWSKKNDLTGGVAPFEGSEFTDFLFAVDYSSDDNNDPKQGFPRLHVYRSSIEMQGSPYALVQKKELLFEHVVLLPEGEYRAAFEGENVEHSSTVFHSPGTAPTVFQYAIAEGENAEVFPLLDLWQKKGNGEKEYPGSPFVMKSGVGTKSNYRLGVPWETTMRLSPGDYTFSFEAFDTGGRKAGGVATKEQQGPIVH